MSEIVTYIRNKKKEPIGTLLAFKDEENKVHIGFSLCKPRKKKTLSDGTIIFVGDVFSKEFGKTIAKNRAKNWSNYNGTTIVGGKVGFNCKFGSKQDFYENARQIIRREKNAPPQLVIPVDASITRVLCDFIGRCNIYYKDAPLPKWAQKFFDDCSKKETN